MSVRLKRVSARRAAKSSGVPGVPGLGSLPEWNLADLYAGLDDPRITACGAHGFIAHRRSVLNFYASHSRFTFLKRRMRALAQRFILMAGEQATKAH